MVWARATTTTKNINYKQKWWLFASQSPTTVGENTVSNPDTNETGTCIQTLPVMVACPGLIASISPVSSITVATPALEMENLTAASNIGPPLAWICVCVCVCVWGGW